MRRNTVLDGIHAFLKDNNTSGSEVLLLNTQFRKDFSILKSVVGLTQSEE